MQQANYSKNLLHSELFWRDQFDWLLRSGYEHRPRYGPDWAPSWLNETDDLKILDAEDSWEQLHPNTLDAKRLSDGQIVTQCIHTKLKLVYIFHPRNWCLILPVGTTACHVKLLVGLCKVGQVDVVQSR